MGGKKQQRQLSHGLPTSLGQNRELVVLLECGGRRDGGFAMAVLGVDASAFVVGG